MIRSLSHPPPTLGGGLAGPGSLSAGREKEPWAGGREGTSRRHKDPEALTSALQGGQRGHSMWLGDPQAWVIFPLGTRLDRASQTPCV